MTRYFDAELIGKYSQSSPRYTATRDLSLYVHIL